jgi:hypothetical protein
MTRTARRSSAVAHPEARLIDLPSAAPDLRNTLPAVRLA